MPHPLNHRNCKLHGVFLMGAMSTLVACRSLVPRCLKSASMHSGSCIPKCKCWNFNSSASSWERWKPSLRAVHFLFPIEPCIYYVLYTLSLTHPVPNPHAVPYTVKHHGIFNRESCLPAYCVDGNCSAIWTPPALQGVQDKSS